MKWRQGASFTRECPEREVTAVLMLLMFTNMRGINALMQLS